MKQDSEKISLQELDLPKGLAKLSYSKLDILAAQIRELILDVVASNGGHLAPNLGVVELTIALLRMYDIERDAIVWDVGHQSYTYKILTGRLNSFHTLRKYKGISGFCRPEESRYDACISGHTSTSVSSAIGIHVARALKNDKGKVVAVIGDGALSGGMAFEALNNLATLHKNIVIILNDNEMSISHNVGGFATYLSSILTGEFATKIKRDIQNIVEDAPLGDKFLSFVKHVESSVISFWTPGSLFENLGIKYIGPVNGHKIKDIEKAISNAFLQQGPVLIHVATVKGKGYEHAEHCPDIFHGVGAFDIATGTQCKSSDQTWTGLFGAKMIELAERDERVVAVTAAMKDGTGLKEFADKFPKRFFDVGIAEQHAVTFSAGLATGGMKPYFAVYSTFLQRAYDQIIHDVAIAKLPVTFCIDRAGLVGADGSTHHGAFDIAYLRLIPNIIIMLPKDAHEFDKMLDMTLYIDGPVAIRYPRGIVANYPELDATEVFLGEPEIVKRGCDIAIVSVGHIFDESYKLYKTLIDTGESVELINLRFLKPLDSAKLGAELEGKKLVITVEDGVIAGGAGESVQSILMACGLTARVVKFGLPDTFIEHGTVGELRNEAGLDAASMFEKIKLFL